MSKLYALTLAVAPTSVSGIAVARVPVPIAFLGELGFAKQGGIVFVFLTLFGFIVVGHFFLAVRAITIGVASGICARIIG